MPVYEFRCSGCNHHFSQFYRSAAAAATPPSCSACGRPSAERAISAFAFHASLQTQIDSIDPALTRQMEELDRGQQATDPINRLGLENIDFGKEHRD